MAIRNSWALWAMALSSLAPLACQGRTHTHPPVSAEAGRPITDLDAFEAGLNRFALLPETAPTRQVARRALADFLFRYMPQQLAAGDEDEAVQALEFAAKLYTPGELHDASLSDPALARAAQEIYRTTARHGAQEPSLLALAVLQRFGDEQGRTHALAQWAMVEEWIVQNGPYSAEPVLRHEELENTLEKISLQFPSPFVTQRLADLYVARYHTAKQNLRTDAGMTAQRRIQITPYLLLRLYLRADDFTGARTALTRVDVDPPVAQLLQLMNEALEPTRSATALLAFADQFVPDPDSRAERVFGEQGWAIVDNLSRRAVALFPKDAYAHLWRARSLRQAALGDAALAHLRRCIALKEDVFAAWHERAELEQIQLQRLAAHDVQAAAKRLSELEAFHRRATELWSGRPVRPGMPEAYLVVAEGLYDAGEGGQAETLLERSVRLEPAPDALDLLGTIALKRSDLNAAQGRYEALAALAYDNEPAKLRWEARARQKLGEIAQLRGDAIDSLRHLRVALRRTNQRLAEAESDPDMRAQVLLERGQLLFDLGDVSLAMDDFTQAEELAPDSASVYSDPLVTAVAHGFYSEARTIFRRALARRDLSDTLKVYFSLWLHELAQRPGGNPEESEALGFLAQYRGDPWAEALARHGRGDLPYAELLKLATDRRRRTEADFYEGLQRWHRGDRDGARQLLKQVIAGGMMGFFEYEMAQHYLRWNDVPSLRQPGAPPPVTQH